MSVIHGRDLAFLDNGVPAQTASAASGNYAMVGSVPIKNASRQTLDTAALAANPSHLGLRQDLLHGAVQGIAVTAAPGMYQ